MKKRNILLIIALTFALFVLSACGGQSFDSEETSDGTSQSENSSVEWESLTYDHSMELTYADQFSVDFYKDGSMTDESDMYALVNIGDDQTFVVVPEGAAVPSGMDEGVFVLERPLDNIYLVATAAMDYFRELDGIGNITLSSQKADNWSITEAEDAMNAGDMVYAGKYSTPDYELIVSSGCDLAIENTMIYHSPEVLEELSSLGIPYIVERSSYEKEPLGRMEWVKLYSVLLGKENEAESYYEDVVDGLQDVLNQDSTDKTVAFFSITTTGAVTVRTPDDYVAKAINMAGGRYLAFDASEENENRSTMTIQMETFYAGAIDADILIYNSTIEGEVGSISELVGKSEVLSDFSAVQNGNVWCMSADFYQQPLKLGDFISDVNAVVHGTADTSELNFLTHLS